MAPKIINHQLVKTISTFFFLSLFLFFTGCKHNVYIENLTIKSLPLKTQYVVGDMLDLDGMVVEATFSDGHTAVVDEYEVIPEKNAVLSEVGKTAVKITYLDKEVSYDVSVLELTLDISEDFPNYTDIYEIYSDELSLLPQMKVSATANGNGVLKVSMHLRNEALNADTIVAVESFKLGEGQTYSVSNTPIANPYFDSEYYYEVENNNNGYIVSKKTSSVRFNQKMPEVGLPLISISTLNNELPTYETVSAPPGCMGAGITNTTKVPGRLMITVNGNVEYDSKEYIKDTSGMTIKIRGNTSAYSQKKPYKIKLQKKANLLNDGNDNNKNKEWLLIKDGVSLNTVVGLKTTELVFDPILLENGNTDIWVPDYRFVNVVLNGEYKGIYLLIESVSRDSGGRIDVDKDTGYIIEKDAYWWNEDLYFDSDGTNMKYTFKYPDAEDITVNDEKYTYIQNYMSLVNSSLSDGTYDDYIDVDSFAKWMLAHDLLGNWDSGGSNVYLTKYDNTDSSKIKMTSLWDFDAIYRMSGEWDNAHTSGFLFFNKLFSSNNRIFVEVYKERFYGVQYTIAQSLGDYLDDYNRNLGDAINASRKLDSRRWDTGYKTVDENILDAVNWFTNRVSWMNNKVDSL